jgi:hypothetical protein
MVSSNTEKIHVALTYKRNKRLDLTYVPLYFVIKMSLFHN